MTTSRAADRKGAESHIVVSQHRGEPHRGEPPRGGHPGRGPHNKH